MIAVYGNSGFWAWLRYWYLDSADFVTLMLIDKGYYDYDYEKPKDKPTKLTAEQKRMWSDAEVASVLGRAINPATGKPIFEQQTKPMTPDEMQRIAMSEAREKKQQGGTK